MSASRKVTIRIEVPGEGDKTLFLETYHESIRAGLKELSGIPDEAFDMMLTSPGAEPDRG